ncbi:MAG: malate synthase A [Bdellovibrionota bacterium]
MEAQAISYSEPTPTSQRPQILSPEARAFLVSLHRNFSAERSKLLNQRSEQAEWLKSGGRLDFHAETKAIRAAEWTVAPCPPDLRVRHAEITGPAEAKMMINALNSGADVFMVDLEDSMSPTWANVLEGQRNIFEAVRGRLEFTSPEGKAYRQNAHGATLLVRPRGWHLSESHFLVDGRPIPASLFDFGLAFFHNARELMNRGSGPYFYLPKLESAQEARLWNKVFVFAQEALQIPRGTIRATVLIETITAAFEMDEILFELREHASGLNAGRWDYLFSVIKKFSFRDQVFPDRALLTMDLPFLRSYCELLVQTCHRRGAHAIGGMSAFIPSRRDEQVNRDALAKVRADKEREISIGFDGSWVAHPDLVGPVKNLFVVRLEDQPDQKHVVPPKTVLPADLLPRDLPATVTEAGVRTNISVALHYLNRWLNGQGAVAIHNLMEDAATAEISRAQLWQWVRLRVATTEGFRLTPEVFETLMHEELVKLRAEEKITDSRANRLRTLLDYLVNHHAFVDFLTKPASEILLAETDTHIN